MGRGCYVTVAFDNLCQLRMGSKLFHSEILFIYLFIYFREGRHANVKTQEAINHVASFLSSREEFFQLGIEPPTSALRFGYLSTIIW
jgi:hypothetical protein